jgi:hypothetical protein
MPTTEINVSRETSGFCNSDSGISGDLIILIQEFLVEDSSVGASLDFSMATSPDSSSRKSEKGPQQCISLNLGPAAGPHQAYTIVL